MFENYQKIKTYNVEEIEYCDPLIKFEKYVSTPGSVLLTGRGDKTNSRYSLIGYQSNLEIVLSDSSLTINEKFQDSNNHWQLLSEILNKSTFERLEYPANICGYIGYISYEMAHQLEQLPKTTIDSYVIPKLQMILYKNYVVFDHKLEKTWQVDFEYLQETDNNEPVNSEDFFHTQNLQQENTDSQYIAKVKKIQDYIISGDVYEVNLTQQIRGEFKGSAFELFKKLYAKNDAPFSCFFNLKDFQIISNSPELFLSANGYAIETRPIKGTIHRSNNPDEDKKNKEMLLKSEKDQAELYMIIDLLRNDLGKVSEIGSVKVIDSKKLERFKNVYHLVGVIQSNLKKQYDYIDLIKATFPGGSITGCPKIRSMEIIDELESYTRNLYTGSIFWMNKHFLKSSIVIRTALIKGNEIFINSGGAITIDSNPIDEYKEMKIKIKNIIEVLGGNNDNLS